MSRTPSLHELRDASGREGVGAGERADEIAWGIQLWRLVARWRRHVDRELSPLGLTLTQWLVLDSTHRLSVETSDAVSQAEVAQHLELDPMTVSHVMRRLEQRGFVDRGPNLVGPSYRIWVTAAGQRVLGDGRVRVEQASRSVLGIQPSASC